MQYGDYIYIRKEIKGRSSKQVEEFYADMKKKGWEFQGYQMGKAIFRKKKNSNNPSVLGML